MGAGTRLLAIVRLRRLTIKVGRRILIAPVLRSIHAGGVGLGKTVEDGLVIRDLLDGNPAGRVLILCPAALTQQWLCELYSKFVPRAFSMLEMHE